MPTSVPIWRDTPPEPDIRGRIFSVLSIGKDADPVADRWCQQLEQLGRQVFTFRAPVAEGPDGPAVRWAIRQGRAARVGWRFCVAGPEADVLLACAAVRGQGALDAEITAHSVSSRERYVLCTHCRAVTATSVVVGDTCTCSGCGRSLLIYHHTSRRHASYMGFMADAETEHAAGPR